MYVLLYEKHYESSVDSNFDYNENWLCVCIFLKQISQYDKMLINRISYESTWIFLETCLLANLFLWTLPCNWKSTIFALCSKMAFFKIAPSRTKEMPCPSLPMSKKGRLELSKDMLHVSVTKGARKIVGC